jgi:deazaflavin-dependent oxidoreductase (nitroreductase family)
MALEGEYEPSPSEWVRDQVAEYESSGGQRANTLMDTGLPIIIVTTRGNKSGKVRKTPVMKVEHEGEYALVASKGGAPAHPVWYYNLISDPEGVMIQDGPAPFDVVARRAGISSAQCLGTVATSTGILRVVLTWYSAYGGYAATARSHQTVLSSPLTCRTTTSKGAGPSWIITPSGSEIKL